MMLVPLCLAYYIRAAPFLVRIWVFSSFSLWRSLSGMHIWVPIQYGSQSSEWLEPLSLATRNISSIHIGELLLLNCSIYGMGGSVQCNLSQPLCTALHQTNAVCLLSNL